MQSRKKCIALQMLIFNTGGLQIRQNNAFVYEGASPLAAFLASAKPDLLSSVRGDRPFVSLCLGARGGLTRRAALRNWILYSHLLYVFDCSAKVVILPETCKCFMKEMQPPSLHIHVDAIAYTCRCNCIYMYVQSKNHNSSTIPLRYFLQHFLPEGTKKGREAGRFPALRGSLHRAGGTGATV